MSDFTLSPPPPILAAILCNAPPSSFSAPPPDNYCTVPNCRLYPRLMLALLGKDNKKNNGEGWEKTKTSNTD